MKVLVTGGAGQLGRSLARCPGVIALDRRALDVTDPPSITAALDAHAPAVVINAAAYTAVDRAESDRERAFAVNARGAGAVAAACARGGVRMLHVSTDYVFDGTTQEPYDEDAAPGPLNVYGESKLAGERLVLDHGGTVVRTSWLFGRGGPSFVHTILRLAVTQPVLEIVADERGTPTYTDDLAGALIGLAAPRVPAGIYHACGTPPTTRLAFAHVIVDEALRYRRLTCTRIDAVSERRTPARRPRTTVLATTRIEALGIASRPWAVGLRHVVADALGGS